jgi:hypothetical protein
MIHTLSELGGVARRACHMEIDERIYRSEDWCDASVYFRNLLSFHKSEALFRVCSLSADNLR